MFEHPDEFDLERTNARRHMAFGYGTHLCAGASLARAEGRVTLNRLFDRTADIGIAEAVHGPPGARTYDYLPTYLFRGLVNLHIELTAKDIG
jgi:cytochrome P450